MLYLQLLWIHWFQYNFISRMAHLRSPLLQNYFNPFNLSITPIPHIQLCVSEDRPSPRQRQAKKDHSPKPSNYPSVRFKFKSNYHKLMSRYLARNINTLTNLNSSGRDFEKNEKIVVSFLLLSMLWSSIISLQLILMI